MATVVALQPKTLTETLDDTDSLYEIINSQRVEKPVSVVAVSIASVLAFYLNAFALPRKLGIALSEPLLRLVPGGDQRRPDVAFVAYERWPEAEVPEGNPWEVVPNLAVEVVSPSNTIQDMVDKIDEYFEAGVPLVWLILPKQRRVYVYESPLQLSVLPIDGEFEGGDVLSGFRLKVAALFEPLTRPQ
jgi:Uma2 family endonuclease